MDTENPGKGKNHTYEATLKRWIEEEKAANELIDVIGKLWFDKSIELILFRRQLIDRGSSSILHKHSYAENIISQTLSVKDSLALAKVMLELDIAPARIDIGRLGKEWLEEHGKYQNHKDFIKDKLSEFIGAPPRSTRTQDVVLYGFGRIGRLLARLLVSQAGDGSRLRLRAIVTRSNAEKDIIKRASLFRKDSVHGHFQGIAVENPKDESIYINGHTVKFIAASNPEEIDYESYGLKDVLVIDNTGIFRDRENLSRHMKSKGVSRVLLTAPGKGDIPNIVYGVNQEICPLDVKDEQIFSAASCTTNAVVPVLRVIEDNLGIVRGHIETIHSYTNDQNLLDNFHSKYRRGRSAPLNMVITETGADSAAVKIIPNLKNKLTANAVRVPTPNVSLVILSVTVEKETTLDDINVIMRKASLEGRLIEQIRFSTSNELVSTDVIGDSCACVYDSPATKVSADKKSIVLYLWYDNEFGYSCQVMRLANHISQVKSYRYY